MELLIGRINEYSIKYSIMSFIRQKIKYLILKFKYSNAYIDSTAFVSMDSVLDKGVKILKKARVGNCKIGRYSYIGINSNFSNTNIGSFCSIGPDVLCGLGDHPIDFVSTYPGFYSNQASGSYWFGHVHDFKEQQNTIIESDVWIGAKVIIKGGVHIGTGAIIGAGAVVTKNIPPYAIVGGIPAKILKYRFDENLISLLIESKWWEKNEETLKNLSCYFNEPLIFLEKLEKF